MNNVPKKKRKPQVPAKVELTVAHSEVVSNLENYLAGYNISRFIEYPDPESDELLNAYMRGYNLSLLG